MKKLLLILLMIPTLSFAKDKYVITFDDDFNPDERFYITDYNEMRTYIKPSVSCLYNEKFYEEQLNYCDKHADPKGIDISPCATARYEKLACNNKQWVAKEEKRVKAVAKAERRRQAEEKENDCIDESARAMNDFAAKKIYNRCMKRKK